MITIALGLFFAMALGAAAHASETLKLVRTIPLPGVRGRFDHFAIDVKGRRLFLAALGNNTLEVVDVAAGKRLQSLTGLRKPTGVVYLADANQIGVANGGDGTFKLFDGATYALVKSLGSLEDADNVRWDARARRLYVGYGEGALAVLDPQSLAQVGTVKLPAHPESFQLESQGSRIFVNVPGAEQVIVLDREKQAAITTWPMKQFKANFPMALDEANHRLFVGCRQPAQLLALDAVAGKTVAKLAISGDPDDLFYDARRKRLYVSCGQGFVEAIDQRTADTYQLRERIPTRAGARTSVFSADLNEFYLAVPQQGSESAEIRVFQAQP